MQFNPGSRGWPVFQTAFSIQDSINSLSLSSCHSHTSAGAIQPEMPRFVVIYVHKIFKDDKLIKSKNAFSEFPRGSHTKLAVNNGFL